jgi:hypothetical protein
MLLLFGPPHPGLNGLLRRWSPLLALVDRRATGLDPRRAGLPAGLAPLDAQLARWFTPAGSAG